MLVVFGDFVLLFGVEPFVVLVHGDEPAVGLFVVIDVDHAFVAYICVD